MEPSANEPTGSEPANSPLSQAATPSPSGEGATGRVQAGEKPPQPAMMNYRYFHTGRYVLDRAQIITVADHRPAFVQVFLPPPMPEDGLKFKTHLAQEAFLAWYLMPTPETSKPWVRVGRWVLPRERIAAMYEGPLEPDQVRIFLAEGTVTWSSEEEELETTFSLELAGRPGRAVLDWVNAQAEVIVPLIQKAVPISATHRALCPVCECPLTPIQEESSEDGQERVQLTCPSCGEQYGPYEKQTGSPVVP